MEPPSIEPLSCILALFQPLSLEVIIGLVLMALLLACSALISGSEVAYFSLGPTEIDQLQNEKSAVSTRILEHINKPQRLLATILITNNFVNIAIVILSTFIVNRSFNFADYPLWVPLGIQVGAVTFLLLLLGEVIPKVYASTNTIFLCRFMAIPLTVLSRIFSPLSSLLVSSTNIINKRVKKRNNDYSVDDLEHAIELTKNSDFKPEEDKILKGIVRFGNTDVKQIMTSRMEAKSFDFETPYKELLDEIIHQGYSRIPIYKETFDQVAGILYLKDLLPYSKHEEFNWQSLLRPPFFVPENKKLDDLLTEFQERKIHMAIVVDEYGGTSGIVTLEDIIEEIVGDITDEFDDEDIFYSKLDDRNYIFEGKTPLIDLYKILEINGDNFEQAKGESDTLAGFVLEMAGKIPIKNERIKFENYVLTIEAADKRRIKRIKLTINEPVDQNKDA